MAGPDNEDENKEEEAPAEAPEAAEEAGDEKKEETVVKELTATKEEVVQEDAPAAENPPSYTLHLHNLPSDLDVAEIEMRLQRFGELLSCVKEGDMFVAKYSRTNDAYKAKEKLNGTSPYGAAIKVEFGPQDADHYNRSKKKVMGRGRKEFVDSGLVTDMGLPKGNNKAKAGMRAWDDDAGAGAGPNKRRKVDAAAGEKAAPATQLAGGLQPPAKPVSRWSDSLTFEEQLEDFLKMPRRGMYNRYLVLGKLPPELRTGENVWRLMQPVQRDIIQVEMLTCFGKPVAHISLRSATAAAAMHRLCEQLHPNLTVAFAPPRRASSTLWLGNVDDYVPRKELEALLVEFGDLRDGLRYLPARTCAFATFPEVGDAVAARNTLYGLEVLRNQYLNVDFVDDNEGEGQAPGWNAWGQPWNQQQAWGKGAWGQPWAAPRAPPWVVQGAWAPGGRGGPEERGMRSDRYGRGRSPPRFAERGRRSRSRRRAREATPQPERRRRREREPTPAEEEQSEVEAPAPAKGKSSKAKVKLYKMGEFCCNIVANFVKGRKETEELQMKLQINQRTKIDHCKAHMDRAGNLATIWHFSAADRKDCAAYDALCDYFVEKQRVGLVQTPSFYVYIVPPTEQYLTELNLPNSNFVVGLQIPIKK